MEVPRLRTNKKRPKYGWRRLLFFWGTALLCWSPAFLYASSHTNSTGELDLGGAEITTDLVQAAEPASKLPAFAVASIRQNQSLTDQFSFRFTPDGVHIENASLLMIIRAAWGLMNSLDDKFIGIPGWAKTEKFNIDAKVDYADVEAYKALTIDQKRLMVQAVLADRFKLKTHPETREQPIYSLTIAKGGPKLKESHPAAGAPSSPGMKESSNGHLVGENVLISELVSELTQTVDRTVEDRTGLAGRYDFRLDWAPDDDSNNLKPSLFTAIQEQLGLKLDPTKAPVKCLVVDHLEQPSEN
jgi:uncharacterized protein (TIGR03435 family)